MISGIQFDNHTQEELPTLQIEYSTLSEENKGLYFLDLVEEGRVLIQNNDQLPMSQSINLYLETSTLHKCFMASFVHVPPRCIILRKFLYLLSLGKEKYLGVK